MNFKFSEGLMSIKKFIEEKVLLDLLWNDVLVVLHIIATALDPLFCYTLIVDEDRNCIGFDNKLRYAVVALRSLVDCVLLVHYFHLGYSNESDHAGGSTCAQVKKYYTIAIDILALLPVPQVMVLFMISTMRGFDFRNAIRSLNLVLFIQYVPRTLRIYSFLKKVGWSAAIIPVPYAAEVKAVFNLFLFHLASHVFGAFWYLFAVERKATCWQEYCENNPNCNINCYYVNGRGRLLIDCSAKSSNFDFGIFGDAFKSGVIYSSAFIWKISYCYWWGLQNLSSLGQGLKTSNYILEIYFAVAITTSGMVFFAILIGNFQMSVQARISRLEKIREKRNEEIEHWIGNHSLPHDLKENVKQYGTRKWQELKDGIDVKKLLCCLPNELRRNTIRHLCLDSLKQVQMFQNMNDMNALDAICHHLKPELYPENHIIFHRGDLIDKMIFIFEGELEIHNDNFPSPSCLSSGGYYGDDLLNWVKQNPSSSRIPDSKEIVRARTKVEAFVLTANDLRTVAARFNQHFIRRIGKSWFNNKGY